MSRTALIPGWYVEFQANVLRQLPRTEIMDQATAEGWSHNQKALKKVLTEVLLPSKIKPININDGFILLSSFMLTVPNDYKHFTQLANIAKFVKDKSEKICFCNNNITDKNFAGVTQQLVPGKNYVVKIFAIKKNIISSEDCLTFLDKQKAILVGAQGLFLTSQLMKNEFPVDKWVVSFDKKDKLWKDIDGNHGVPYAHQSSVGDWEFLLGRFEGDWGNDSCLLCFYDLSV